MCAAMIDAGETAVGRDHPGNQGGDGRRLAVAAAVTFITLEDMG